jgi:hypothetical protein
MATWDDVRELARELPDAEETTSYRQPALKVAGKLFANMSPRVFYVTPHYRDHPLVLVRLDAVARDELRERLVDSWLLRAPPNLVDAYERDR